MKALSRFVLTVSTCIIAACFVPQARATMFDVSISGFAFNPPNITIRKGDTVRWTNSDPISHTATSGSACTPDGTFDTQLIAPNTSASAQFPDAGTFPYFCQVHCFSMSGSITVEGASNALPAVSISSPTNGATIGADGSVTIIADATDAEGPVPKVEFFDGTTSLGIATNSPYSITVILAPGAHALTAVATDAANATQPSSVVTIEVKVAIIPDPVPVFITKGELSIELQTIVDGLASPLGMAVPDDGSGRMFVFDQSGLVWLVTSAGKSLTALLDVHNRLVTLSAYDERGLLGMAVHPNFAQHPLIYTYTSEPNGPPAEFPTMLSEGATNDCQSVITEWRLDSTSTNTVNLASRRELFRIDKPQFNHNGGTMHFGPDGFLYLSVGDGGNANDIGEGHMPGGNAQDTGMALGKILRIDVDGTNSKNGKYGVPSENPFVGGGGLPEIFAYGFRNPYQWSFDRSTGQGIIGDVGQDHVEEIDLLVKGGNFGWNIKEGTFWFDPATGNDVSGPLRPVPPGLIDPIAEYGHGDGLAIIGGYIYHGTSIPSLQGRYVFADWGSFTAPSARLFYLDTTNLIREFKIGPNDRSPGLWIKGFGEGPDGELYVFASRILGPSGNTGKMLKIVAPPQEILSSNPAVTGQTNLTFSWTGGSGPFALQEKTSIADFTWRNSAFSSQRTAVVPIIRNAGFFRVLDTAHQSGTPFSLFMNAALERPANNTGGTGSGTLVLEGNSLSFNIEYRGLSGGAIAAHIHGPATTATSTNVMIDLGPYSVGPLGVQGAFSGVVVLSDEQKAIVLSGHAYVNVHTPSHTGGEIRGQIAPVLMQVALTGPNERPSPIATDATGFGLLTLVGNQLSLNLQYRNLSGVAIASHIHGPTNSEWAAPVMVDLQSFNGGAFGTNGSLAGAATLSSDQLAAVIDGLAYINIHTPSNSSGEIRGQLLPQSTGLPLSAYLNGEAEVPKTDSAGLGTGLFSLEGDLLRFSITYSNLSGPGIAAHIHGPAGPGQSTNVLVDLAPFSPGPLGVNGSMAGAVMLTPTQRGWVLSGRTYVNVHTENHSSGEIRGQIASVSMTASLAGFQQLPSVVSGGLASGTFTLVGNQLGFNLNYGGLSGTATGAQLRGPAGAFGFAGVLQDLSSFNGGGWGTSGALAGTVTLNATNALSVIGGQTYLNIDSAAFSAGELRGQLIP